MDKRLQEIILKVIGRYLDVQVKVNPEKIGADYIIRMRRSDPTKAYKSVAFNIKEVERLTSDEIMDRALEENFEVLIIGLMDDTDTLFKLQNSWLQRIYFLFNNKLLK